MNSNDREDGVVEGLGMVLDLRVGQFKVIDQLAKELPNLDDEALSPMLCTRNDANAMLQIFRSARSEIGDGVENVRVCAVAGISEASMKPSPVTLILTVPLSGFLKWHSLIEAIHMSFGERELFFRTGYDGDEIEAVVGLLNS